MRHSILLLATTSLLTAGTLVVAQNPAAPPAPPPLGGPKVHQTDAPGAYMSFGGEGVARMFRSNLRQYAGILKDMTLSEDQRVQVEAIMREYAETVRAYQEEHAPEMRRLRQIAVRANRDADPRASASDRAPNRRDAEAPAPPDRRRDGVTDRATDRRPDRATDRSTDRATDRRPMRETDRADDRPSDRPVARPAPPADARPDAARPGAEVDRPAPGDGAWEMQSKEVREAMERFEAIRRAAPPQEPYMKRLYEVLTPEQQAEFDRRMEVLREAQAEQQMRRRLAAAGVDPEAMQGMEGMQRGEDGRPMLDESELTPQMRQRLRRLREERRRLLENRERTNPAPPTPDEIEFEEPDRKKRP